MPHDGFRTHVSRETICLYRNADYGTVGGAGLICTGMPGSAIPEPLDPLPLDPALPPLTPGVGHAITPSLEMAQPGATHAGADCGSTAPSRGAVGGPPVQGGGGGHAGAVPGAGASGAYGMGIAHGGGGAGQGWPSAGGVGA
jgi:hypothetical protein